MVITRAADMPLELDMNHRLLLVALVSCAACGCGAASPSKAGPPSQAHIDFNVVHVLGQNLLSAHATLDSAPITDVRATGRCSATISTGSGVVVVQWHDLGNLAPRDDGHLITFRIPAGGRQHVLAAAAGDTGDRINMGLGLLDADCGGV